jgi:hypothetical protein
VITQVPGGLWPQTRDLQRAHRAHNPTHPLHSFDCTHRSEAEECGGHSTSLDQNTVERKLIEAGMLPILYRVTVHQAYWTFYYTPVPPYMFGLEHACVLFFTPRKYRTSPEYGSRAFSFRALIDYAKVACTKFRCRTRHTTLHDDTRACWVMHGATGKDKGQ